MKEFKGTKGDWEFSKSRGVIFSENCDYIADVCGTNATREEESANARLISAAPEMLALLQKLVDIEGVQPGDYLWAREVFSVIKKALGEDE